MKKLLSILSIVIFNIILLTTNANSTSVFSKIKGIFSERPRHQLTKQESIIIHNENDKLGAKFNVMVDDKEIAINDIKTLNTTVTNIVNSIKNSNNINKIMVNKILYIQNAISVASKPTAQEGLLYINILHKLTEVSDLIRHGNVSKSGINSLAKLFSPLLDIIDKWEETGDLSYDTEALRELLTCQ